MDFFVYDLCQRKLRLNCGKIIFDCTIVIVNRAGNINQLAVGTVQSLTKIAENADISYGQISNGNGKALVEVCGCNIAYRDIETVCVRSNRQPCVRNRSCSVKYAEIAELKLALGIKVQFTRSFEDTAVWLSLHLSRKAIAEYLQISWDTVGPMVTGVEQELSARRSRFDGPVNITIDETSYKKGHKYLTLILNHDTNAVVWAGKGYGKAVLEQFFTLLTPEQRQRIHLVSGDGAQWINARMEATNNKVKLTLRMAYGFRNIDHLISAIFLRCGNLPIYPPGRQPIPATHTL